MTGNVGDKVLEWLRTTGYPLELRIGSQLQLAQWHVNYGRRYSDAESGKNRELDIHALVAAIHPKTASIFFSLCIECKTSSKPWVALSGDRTLGNAGLQEIAMGPLSEMTLIAARSEKVPLPPLFPSTTPVVGGVIQAFGGQDEGSPVSPYAALMQARSAAFALDASYFKTAKVVSNDLTTTGIFLPIVVFDGTLLRYSIQNDLQEHIEEVDMIMAVVPGDASHADALVPVITASHAVAMGEQFFAHAHAFCVTMLPHSSLIQAALEMDLGYSDT